MPALSAGLSLHIHMKFPIFSLWEVGGPVTLGDELYFLIILNL